MKSLIKYQLLSFFYSLQWIAPVVLYICWIFTQYYYQGLPITESFSISALFLFPTMVWVSMKLFSLEKGSEKSILLSYVQKKQSFLYGKMIVIVIIGLLLMGVSFSTPLILRTFTESLTIQHIGAFLYSHLLFLFFGLWIGGLFSVTDLAGKKYSWVAAAFFTCASIVGESLMEDLPSVLKWLVYLLPPVSVVEADVTGNMWAVVYVGCSLLLLVVLFLRKERIG
ncbi:hypothetical protein [Bacillus sp. FJAT-42315]|uniref:hypothetical protein n=1 Tax=Bacillus sp. FJAT-42315 TaxID=2014077 RepID=UPI000C2386B2|nr:hypothetical protein [Bacillus sp. FJAT-42315]